MSQVTIWSSSILSYQLNNVHIVQCMQWWIAMEMVNWWTWDGFLVNFGWIWHPSSFGVCVGQWREGNFDQFQYLPILTIGPRQSTHPSLENFQETRAGWILKRNFFWLRGTFLFCSSFCSAVGVSSVILRIIFQTEFHLTLLISHSSSLLPLSARNWQVLERESYSRGKAQYILQYTSFATHNQIPGICNWQRLPYKSDLKKYSATENLCLQNPIQLVPHVTGPPFHCSSLFLDYHVSTFALIHLVVFGDKV